MRVSLFSSVENNNPFVVYSQNKKDDQKLGQNNKLGVLQKDTVSFGNYYSVGRGVKPELRVLAEQSLESSGNASVLMRLAQDLKKKALAMLSSGNPERMREAESLKDRADQMISDIEAEIQVFQRRQEMMKKF